LELVPYVEQITIPTIFFHGEADNFVGPHHSQILFDSLKSENKELKLVKGNHNSFRSSDFHEAASQFIFNHVFKKNRANLVIPKALSLYGGYTQLTSHVKFFLCKQLKLNVAEEEKLEHAAKKTDNSREHRKEKFVEDTDIQTHYEGWDKNVVVVINQDNIQFLRPYTLTTMLLVHFGDLRNYFAVDETLIILTADQKIALLNPQVDEMDKILKENLDAVLRARYGNLDMDSLIERLDGAVEKLLAEVYKGQKADAKKITSQLLKEVNEIMPVDDEEELENAIFAMVTRKTEKHHKNINLS